MCGFLKTESALFKGAFLPYNVELWACTPVLRSLVTKYVDSPPSKPVTMFSHTTFASMKIEKAYLEPSLCITCAEVGA